MKIIDASTRRRALLRIYRRQSGTRKGLAAYELGRAWVHTGLRERDLAQALREFLYAQLLVADNSGPVTRYALTRAGQRALGRLRRWPREGVLTAMIDCAALWWVRRRRRTFVRGFRRRRMGDSL